jgi:hypothetical protein
MKKIIKTLIIQIWKYIVEKMIVSVVEQEVERFYIIQHDKLVYYNISVMLKQSSQCRLMTTNFISQYHGIAFV